LLALVCRGLTGRGRRAVAPRERQAVSQISRFGEDDDRVRNAFGRETYARLAAIKKMYDPTNFFRLNQNIPPSKPR